MLQDKQKERAFFDKLGEHQPYNVFTDQANKKIVYTIQSILKQLQCQSVRTLVDIGCGSGIFTQLLVDAGYDCVGVDLSYALLQRGKQDAPRLAFLQADVEALPFPEASLDVLILSCLLHHLPDLTRCIAEVHRVLKPGGCFVAFDPNRWNPFMYLYRDPSSPFYSSKGVTPNERPIMPGMVRRQFQSAGFDSYSQFVAGLSYRYVASDAARGLLPIYNFIDQYGFQPFFLAPFRAFVFTYGLKRPNGQ